MPVRRPHIIPRIDSEESGYAPLDQGMRKRHASTWKKIALGLVILAVCGWFAVGGKKRGSMWSGYGDTEEVEYIVPSSEGIVRPPGDEPAVYPHPPQRPPAIETDYDDLDQPLPSSTTLSDPSDLPKPPTSPETDPNPLLTTHCKSPQIKGKRLVQYALMIDAGSTGSRIHVYKFHNCHSSPTLEYEVFKQSRPGLSSYAGFPDEAARSLDVLMDEAVAVVPKELVKCTPVAVKATAGLRLLGMSESEEILQAVRDRLTKKYMFPVLETDGVIIMDGKDEGVYAWITANYLLSTIGSHANASVSTYAVMDLGGASTQIVFEPRFSTSDSSLADGDHKYSLQFAGRTHTLYQHSYLGYGLMQARRHVHNLVGFMWDFAGGSTQTNGTGIEDVEVGNPCLAKGTKRLVELEVGDIKNVTMVGADVGSFEACNRLVELVMAKDAICHVKPCSFNGVYQPSLLDTFPTGGILALSYFYDRVTPLLPPSSASTPIAISRVGTLAQQVCDGASSWEEHFGHLPDAEDLMEELAGRPEWCLDLTFMHALLRLGYELGAEREVRVEKKVEDVELGWCLGATLAMLDGELTCRV